MLTSAQLLHFKNLGYLILPEFTSSDYCERVIELAKDDLKKQVLPIEYEADTHYPGAPLSRSSEGGNTARRLLNATQRHPMVMDWATGDSVKGILHQLLGSTVFLSQVHHNCIMTKQPKFSSTTGWHRDNRYWHFERPELVSAWLALSEELPENGCLWIVPYSHKRDIDAYQLDDNQFLIMESARNKDILGQAIPILLNKGDLLLFHSNLFHAAGRNTTGKTKFSMAFTYRAGDNPPIRGTRSSNVAEIAI